jgi:hypothetical protein
MSRKILLVWNLFKRQKESLSRGKDPKAETSETGIRQFF